MQPKTKICKTDTILFHENDHSRELYIIQSGRLKVFRMICGKVVELAVLEKGAVLGEMALIDGKPRSASVKAIEDSTVVVIDAETFHKKIAGVPSWFMSIIRMTSMKIRRVNSRLQRLYGSNLGANIVLSLNYMFVHKGKMSGGNPGKCLNLSQTRRELIQLLGSTYQRITKTIEFLQEKGFVDITDNNLYQSDPAEMEKYCSFLRLLIRKGFENCSELSPGTQKLVVEVVQTDELPADSQDKRTELSGEALWPIVADAGLQDTCMEKIRELKEANLLTFQKDSKTEKSANMLDGYMFSLNTALWNRYFHLIKYRDMIPLL
ncbi:MAG: cyclic nucleotide-binding domain-containing protein [Chitinivibrionales bacterium]|nr:cyclic nucleotide-binding domain-containing protein [Chitinivibrionales bacterium]